MKPRILTIGSLESDFCLDISRFPDKGEELSDSGSREYRCGGRGSFAAVTFSRLGADCIFCGKIGNDAEGARLKQIFARYGIDTRFITASRLYPTDFAIAVTEDVGAPRRLRFPGASAALTSDDIEEAFTTYPDTVFLQLDVPEAAALAALKFAKKQNVRLVVDASPISRRSYLEQFSDSGEIDVFITNTEKTRDLTGVAPNSADNCLRAAIKLASIVRANHYIIKIGNRGIFLYDNTYYKIIPTYECDVVDRTAAGDAFSAALTWQYAASKDLVSSVKYANAVASLVVSKKGGVESIPSLGEITSFVSGEENG